MLQLEMLAFYGVLAGINLAIFLGICISHKRTSVDRIRELKDDWFITLPLKFIDLAKDIVEEKIEEKTIPKELKKIIASYDALEDLELSYMGKSVDNILTLLSINFLFLVGSGLFVTSATIVSDFSSIIMLAGSGGGLLLYFFVYLFKVINFLRTEEDKFQRIQNGISTYLEELENEEEN